MAAIPLILAPNPIFKSVSAPVEVFDDATRALVKDIFDTLYKEQGLGLAAPMCGIATRIVVIDLQEDGIKAPKAYINPEIVAVSEEMQTFTEASLSFPGISAEIARPKCVTVNYLDETGSPQAEDAEGWRATVIQHEIDYLNGITYLDYLKPLKRQMLLDKMKKVRKRLIAG